VTPEVPDGRPLATAKSYGQEGGGSKYPAPAADIHRRPVTRIPREGAMLFRFAFWTAAAFTWIFLEMAGG